LIRRIVNGKVIPSINPLVDLYNIASIKYEMPAGGEDLDVITADIELTFADGTEEFICLGETEAEHPNPDEIVYKFGSTVICRNFNYRESDITKLTEDTQNALIVFECVNAYDTAILQEALDDLSGQIQKFLRGDTRTFVLDKDHAEATL
jgi:DNA/RNA-binding domain of Phe-tRNA-synthetase-like protein